MNVIKVNFKSSIIYEKKRNGEIRAFEFIIPIRISTSFLLALFTIKINTVIFPVAAI